MGILKRPTRVSQRLLLACRIPVLDGRTAGEVGLQHQGQPVEDAGLDPGPRAGHRRRQPAPLGGDVAQLDVVALVVEPGEDASLDLQAILQPGERARWLARLLAGLLVGLSLLGRGRPRSTEEQGHRQNVQRHTRVGPVRHLVGRGEDVPDHLRAEVRIPLEHLAVSSSHGRPREISSGTGSRAG